MTILQESIIDKAKNFIANNKGKLLGAALAGGAYAAHHYDVGGINEKISQVGTDVSNGIHNVAKNVEPVASNIAHTVSNGIHNVAKNVEPVASNIAHTVSNGIHNVAKNVEPVASNIAHTVSNGIHNVAKTL